MLSPALFSLDIKRGGQEATGFFVIHPKKPATEISPGNFR